MSELDKHKGWSDSRILFFLIQEHPSFIQIFLMTFAKFFATESFRKNLNEVT